MKEQIKEMGKRFIEEGITDPKVLACDQKIFEAKGPLWHKKDRKKGEIPRETYWC